MSQIFSIVEYYGCQKVSSCGYCKTAKGHSNYGMWLHYSSVNDYQNLIDRGWRRSGSYGYKPLLQNACCWMYTIKCVARELKLSKGQKKLIKRFNRFIVNGERRKWHNKELNTVCEKNEIPFESYKPEKPIKRIEESSLLNPECTSSPMKLATSITKTSAMEKISSGSTKVSQKPTKKKFIRIERAKKRIMQKGKTEQEAVDILKAKKKIPKVKTLEELMRECEKPNSAHNLEIKIVQCSPENDLFKKTFDMEYKIYRKYQLVIHKDNPNKCTTSQFRRFLVNSPLEPYPIGALNAPVQSFGSYHQQYWLDGEMIAVGVIDILPLCLSSVYFFYDPDYSDLVLGTYGSMKELQLVRELNKYVPSLQYYYMGYYIHTCPKMRYKARISPSYLLCPETYTWHPISQCLDKIETGSDCRLNPDPSAKDEFDTANYDNIKVLYCDNVMKYGEFRKRRRNDDSNEIKEFVKAVGRTCAYSMILYRSSNEMFADS